MRHFKNLLLIFLLIALLTSACGQSDQGKKDSSPIIIGYSQWPGYGVINIADQQGYFDDEGVKVQIVVYNSYDASVASLMAGKIDAVTMTLPDAINMSVNQSPLQVVWALDMSSGGDKLVGSRTLTSPADLKGKRVAFSTGSFGELFVIEGLKKYGLTKDDIIPVNMAAEQVPDALAAGEIDAGHAWDPFASQAIANGAKVLFTSADTPGAIIDTLVFRADVIQDRPDDVRAVTQALAKAMTFWQQNPGEGNVIVARAVAIPENEIEGVLGGLQVFTLEDNRVVLDRASSDPRSTFLSGQAAVEFLLALGSLQTAPDLDSIINPSFVQD